MTPAVIKTESLTRCFGAITAVDQLTLTIQQGEVFGFLGPNGAGKTSTVRLLNGVLTATSGRAVVLGMDVQAQGSAIRRRTGVLTESPSLYERLTGRENLLTFGALYDIPEHELATRVSEAMEFFGLKDRADEKAGGYSKGMKQRLAVARALLHRPELLFLDEPTASLDPAAARSVTDLIEVLSHQEGRTVFLCTHNLGEAQRLCDRVGVISQGRLIAMGTPAELAKELFRSTWVDIDLDEDLTGALVQQVRGIEAVVDLIAEPGHIAVQVREDEVIPKVVAAVVEAGGQIYRVAPREHTLEETYFELQGDAS